MATIQLTIPDDKLDLVIDALCTLGGYEAQVPDPNWVNPGDGSPIPMIDNPQSKASFARGQLYAQIRQMVIRQRNNELQWSTQLELDTLRADVSEITE